MGKEGLGIQHAPLLLHSQNTLHSVKQNKKGFLPMGKKGVETHPESFAAKTTAYLPLGFGMGVIGKRGDIRGGIRMLSTGCIAWGA